MIVVRLEDGRLVDLWGLGFKDHSLPGQGLDASDRDDTIHIANWPVFGVPMPDAIAFARGADGHPYVLTANAASAHASRALRLVTRTPPRWLLAPGPTPT